VVIVGGVLGDGVEIIVRKECMDFSVVVTSVYNYCRLAFVSSGDHGIAAGGFLVNLL